MQRRTRAGFSMMEIMIAAVVLVILCSVAVAGYQGYRDRAAMLVDETNQKVLAAAIKLYAYDNNALPASLSELRPRHLERAFAQVTEGKRPYNFFAYLKERVGMPVAEAQVLPARYYNNNPAVLACPLDSNPPSYDIVIVGNWNRMTLRDFLALPGNQRLLQEDPAEPRHVGRTTIVITTVSGSHERVNVTPSDTVSGSYESVNVTPSHDEEDD